MNDDLHMLTDAMTIKERLRLLADIQASYLRELTAQGVEQSVAEQLLLDWSRHAFAMTVTRDHHAPTIDDELHDLLGLVGEQGCGDATAADGRTPEGGDPSRVPPGEPWLQLVDDCDADDAASHADGDADGEDHRRAA